MATPGISRKQFINLSLGLGGAGLLGCTSSAPRGVSPAQDEDPVIGAAGSGGGGSKDAAATGGAPDAGSPDRFNEVDAGVRRPGPDGAAGPEVAPPPADAAAGGKDLVIDTHIHVWSNDPVAFPYDHPYEKAAYVPGLAPGNVEVLVAEMDMLGVDNAVLIQAIQHGWDNRYIASCLKAYPKRFRAHGLMDPTATGLADTLDRWVTQYGLSGMRISPVYYIGKDTWMTSNEHKLLWQKAEKLGAIFNYFLTIPQLAKLEMMIKMFPGVRIVIDHLARLDLTVANPMADFQKLLNLAAYPNVWVKVSELSRLSLSKVYPFTDTFPWVKLMYQAFGPDRLLWGTGFPGAAAKEEVMWPTGPQELDLIRTQIGFKPQDVPKILGRNAAALWKFPIA